MTQSGHAERNDHEMRFCSGSELGLTAMTENPE